MVVCTDRYIAQTQEVEQGASRRLLQKINCFQEEVIVVEDVLTQQIRVLDDFGELLNPETYSKPSDHRKDQYHDELERIKLLQTEIRERLIHCQELQERSLHLATRNVQLVEASADHSSRAIVIFTFVTVLFLPLTFVAGVFAISGTKHDFGVVASWTTAGVVVFCAIVAAWGEEIWLALYLLPLKIIDYFKQKY
jgi:Mg2+ and Co2+ transporter CorA